MLTSLEIKQFQNEGFLIFEELIQGSKLDRYVDVFDRLVESSRSTPIGTPHWSFELNEDREQNPDLLHKIQGICVLEPKVLDLAKEPEILDRIEPLLGKNLDVFGTKFFPKLSGGGTSVFWHQDSFYFGTQSDEIISCAIYLQDSDAENGWLRLIPKSHLTDEIAQHQSKDDSYGSWVEEIDESDVIDAAVPAGTVVFFSSNLLHGTYPNISQRSRYSTAWHYIPGSLNLEHFPRGGYDDRHIVRGV